MPAPQNVDSYLSRITDALHSQNFNEADFLNTVRSVLDDYSHGNGGSQDLSTQNTHSNSGALDNNSNSDHASSVQYFEDSADNSADTPTHSSADTNALASGHGATSQYPQPHPQAVDHSGDNSDSS